MKKQIALLALTLGLVLPSHAQYLLTRQEHKALQEAVERTQAQTNKIKATLTVEIPVTKQYFTNLEYADIHFTNSAGYRTLHGVPTYSTTVGCKAYALSNRWLIAGAVCLWNGRHTINIDGKKLPTGLIEEDYTKKYLKVDDIQIEMEGNLFVQPRFTLSPHFLLVRVPENSPLAAKVKNMPKIHMLALTHTSPLTLKMGTFHVNSSRFGLNIAQLSSLSSFNEATHTVTIKERFGDFSTLSNDPLLFAWKQNIYWVGINTGVMLTYPHRKWDGQASTEFAMFNNADMDFIEHTIKQQDLAAWAQISKRLHRDRSTKNILEIL